MRVLVGTAGAVGVAVPASACSNPPTPSAQNGTTTTTATARAHTSTSMPGSTAGPSSTSTTSAAHGGAAGTAPTLGVATAWGASAVGFGQVKPAEISLEGDPTGMLTGITWQSWGGGTATGTGTSTYVGPNQSAAQGVQERGDRRRVRPRHVWRWCGLPAGQVVLPRAGRDAEHRGDHHDQRLLGPLGPSGARRGPAGEGGDRGVHRREAVVDPDALHQPAALEATADVVAGAGDGEVDVLAFAPVQQLPERHVCR